MMHCGVIDPVALDLGFFQITWYALAYVVSLIIGWRFVVYLSKRPPTFMTTRDVDDFFVWAALGVILGGRLGYVLFYKPEYYLENLAEIPMLWTGGMSFHGGMLGVIAAIIVFALVRKLPLLRLGDIICCAVPIGLFFGRIANFINGELWGRPTDVAWGMVFTCDPEQLVRHPSQLYQAALEGLVVFALLWILRTRTDAWRRPGTIAGAFLAGYGIARIVGELFREPDAHLGFIIGQAITMGQILSLPMVLVGLGLIANARIRRPVPADAK
ncbi:MAG: prolipoprotein diacylglyceryl transferase [Alphaproteobacteria bacterium]